jgi:hypothetical protein
LKTELGVLLNIYGESIIDTLGNMLRYQKVGNIFASPVILNFECLWKQL